MMAGKTEVTMAIGIKNQDSLIFDAAL
jgi:hypothetical protein